MEQAVQTLPMGGNANVLIPSLTMQLRWSLIEGRDVEIDASAYLLDGSGKVRGDHDMVFYNQPVGGDGSVRLTPGQPTMFDIDLASIPRAIERIALCLTIDEAHSKGHTLALITNAEILLTDGGEPLLTFQPELAGATQAAMIMGELYRRDAGWKFRAVGQGFDGGLAPLARSFGIDVSEEATPPEPAAAPAPKYETIHLEPEHSIRLERAENFGEISVSLNWSHGRRNVDGGGAIDLDLGCLVEMQDGRKGAVQAIGTLFGSFDNAPFVLLSGDDRTGIEGETLRINGSGWPEIKRILIFTNFYISAPDWQAATPQLLVSAPNQPPVQFQVSEGQNDRRICALALLENDAGAFIITRLVEYFADHKELDARFGWGLRWQPGAKI